MMTYEACKTDWETLAEKIREGGPRGSTAAMIMAGDFLAHASNRKRANNCPNNCQCIDCPMVAKAGIEPDTLSIYFQGEDR